METLLVNARLYGAGGATAMRSVWVRDGRIEAVLDPSREGPASAKRIDLGGLRLLPGYVDTQVNGGGGVLFNDHPSVEAIDAIGRAHRRHGTTGFLPTLISDDVEVIARGIAAVEAAIAAGVPGVLGIHIEGPFLNPERKGIHDPARLRRLDASLLPLLTSLRRGRTLLTLAPELTSPELIRALCDAGVIVAAGHTNATCTEVEAALRAGLTGFTHLFNAMSPLTSREPGVVGAALAAREAWCGIIVDGQHVDPRTLRIALAARGPERFMLVTDAMPSVGTEAESFVLQGKTIHVRDGYCVDDAGTLAGTALDMERAVRNAVMLLGVSGAEAVRMASESPARFLGRGTSHGAIAAGARADFVVANDDLSIVGVWQDGRPA